MSKGRYECGACGADFHDHCVNLCCPVGFWNVKSVNPEEVEDHYDPLQSRSTKSYELGRITGYRDVSEAMIKDAGHAYSQRADERAKTLRDLSDMFKDNAKRLRQEWDKKYKKEGEW